MRPFTSELVDGVVEHGDRIDDLLSTYSQGWTLDRMPAVDRNLLRIGVYELLWERRRPRRRRDLRGGRRWRRSLSTDESPTFVNGLLGRILEVKPRLALD